MKRLFSVNRLKPFLVTLINVHRIRPIKISIKLIFLLLLISGNTLFSVAQNLSIKVVGNEIEGYGVSIYDDEKLIVSNKGEFTLLMTNLDSSAKDEIISWKGSRYKTDGKNITLEQETYLKEFDANLSIKINYEVVNPNVIKKTVTLFQP